MVLGQLPRTTKAAGGSRSAAQRHSTPQATPGTEHSCLSSSSFFLLIHWFWQGQCLCSALICTPHPLLSLNLAKANHSKPWEKLKSPVSVLRSENQGIV